MVGLNKFLELSILIHYVSHHYKLNTKHFEMTGFYRLNTFHGSGGSRNQQIFNSKQNLSDRWGTEDRSSDIESQSLTQQSSQRTQPISSSQTNQFDNILSTQRHAEVVSYLKQLSRSMSEANSKQNGALSDLFLQLQLVTKSVSEFSADACRLECSNREQLSSLEIAVSKIQRELLDLSDLTKKTSFPLTKIFSENRTNPTGSVNNIDENEEGICVSDYLYGIQKRRLRQIDIDTNYPSGEETTHSSKKAHIETMTGAVDEYDDLFMDDMSSKEAAVHLRHQANRQTQKKEPRGMSNSINLVQSGRSQRREMDCKGEDVIRRRTYSSNPSGTSELSVIEAVASQRNKVVNSPVRWGGKRVSEVGREDIAPKKTRKEYQIMDKWGSGSVTRKSRDSFIATAHINSLEKVGNTTFHHGDEKNRSHQGQGRLGRPNAH